MNDLDDLKNEELPQVEDTSLDNIVWRKIDIRVLPLCASFFLLAAVDRTSIGNARVAGLQSSLGLSNYQYTVAITVTLYITSQLPSALLLKYVRPNIMLPAIVTLWGVITTSQGFVDHYSELLVCRFFLGLVEGLNTFMFIYRFTRWPLALHYSLLFTFPSSEVAANTVIALFFASASLAGAFSGLLAAAIEHLDGMGGRPGWAWIFILEGSFTFIFGIISFFLLPRSPETARFLTDPERAYVVSALKRASSVSEDSDKDAFSWAEVVNAAKSPHVWFFAVMSFLSGALVLGLAYFEPTIVAGLGYTGTRAQLMSVPPFAVTFVLCIISAIVSDRYRCRGYAVILSCLLEVIGFSMYYASTSNHMRYISIFFALTGAFCSVAPQNAWVANNSAPHARRATAIGVAYTTAELGGILSTWLLGSLSPAPNYTAAAMSFAVTSVRMVVLSSANLAYLSRENRLKAKKRQRMKKEEEEPSGLGDRSVWFVYSL